jgi:hypothetical protein
VDDQFTRTVASGLGSAPTGGVWSTSTAASNYAVANGLGLFAMAPGGSPVAALNTVSAAATDARLAFRADAPVTGSGLYVSTYGRRVSGQGGYAAKTKITGAGGVTLELVRTPASGSDVSLQAATTVPGLAYATGDTLNVRVQTTGTAPTTVRAKVWKAGTPEPTTWLRSATDTTAGLQTAGRVGVGAYLSSTATSSLKLGLDSFVVTAP